MTFIQCEGHRILYSSICSIALRALRANYRRRVWLLSLVACAMLCGTLIWEIEALCQCYQVGMSVKTILCHLPFLSASPQDREYDRFRGKNQSHTKQTDLYYYFSSVKANVICFQTMSNCKNVDRFLRHNVQHNKPDTIIQFICNKLWW